MAKIGQLMQRLGVTCSGPITTATYGIKEGAMEQVMDIELLVPLDRQVELPSGYTFKPLIKLVNAICARHMGHPGLIGETINELNDYIIKHDKQVITATYNVTTKEAESEAEINDMIIDIYVGCNPCIV
ncbi:MAG: AraC family transcriptional regulator [Clostridium sp.]|nr:AraC family transcriptional regulator [Clostridium sp.]